MNVRLGRRVGSQAPQRRGGRPVDGRERRSAARLHPPAADPINSIRQERFDERFYERFYFNPGTRVATRAEVASQARTVATLVQHLELPVRRILDAGCGLGWMRAPLLRAFPGAKYTGLEVSAHLCKKYGWIQGSLSTYRARSPFDLVICNDVMQYLPEREAARAMANLGALSRGALYFHTPTIEDWRSNADRSVSDSDVHLRSADWYRARLSRGFRHAGFGIHVRRGVPLIQWELEAAEASRTPSARRTPSVSKRTPGRTRA